MCCLRWRARLLAVEAFDQSVMGMCEEARVESGPFCFATTRSVDRLGAN
jgi:hypothetical protein